MASMGAPSSRSQLRRRQGGQWRDSSYANVADSMKMNVDELKDELEHLGEIYVSGPLANKIKSLLSVLK